MPRRGFTLVELLIVIVIVGILAAGVFSFINPAKRVRQANDAKIKTDVGQISGALQGQYTLDQVYPSALSDLVTKGGLKTIPTPPGGGVYSYSVSSPCTPASCEAAVSFALQDPTASGNLWCWRSATGAPAEVASCAP
ncbi:MAG: type II secretion system protein [bacterium]|nr:type II secretion system protein [bacterium]